MIALLAPASTLFCNSCKSKSNPSDSACTIVNYSVNSLASLEQNTFSSYFSDFHPNPSSTISFLEYKLNYYDEAEIIVTDILGNVIHNKNIFGRSGVLRIDFSDIKNGLYFANIILNGELHSIKRLVINK